MHVLPACLASLAVLILATPAMAQVAIEDIKIQLFQEKSGTFSGNIADGKKAFVNTPTGEGGTGEPADSILITLTFTGSRNTVSSEKIARDVASVSVTQMTKSGPKISRKAYAGFRFDENGHSYKAFSMDGATCLPLEVEVKVGKSRKSAKVDFSCVN